MIVMKVNKNQMCFIEELEKDYNMTLEELKGYYAEAIKLKLIEG